MGKEKGMTTQHTPRQIRLSGVPHYALPAAVRRRRLAGLLLLVLGGLWLGLSLTGHAADLPFPIRWLDVIGGILEYAGSLGS
jgi:hypothetical protein